MLFDPKWECPADVVGKVMLAAADLIEREGHCKRMMFDGHGYCILGALRWVLQGTQYPANGYDKIVHRLERVLGDKLRNLASIAVFNDTHTKEEAIALLREAAGK